MFGPGELASAVAIVSGIGAMVVYFVPTIVAAASKHHNTTAIFVLNLFLGWTLIGWVAALVWACTKPPPEGSARPR